MHAGDFKTLKTIVQYETGIGYFILYACYTVATERIKPITSDKCGSDCPSSRCCADDLHRQGNTGYSVCQETVALNISGRSGKAIRSVCLRGGKAGLTLF